VSGYALDPGRLIAIHEALAQWRMYARSAHVAGQADQRRLSLDLLHSVRHLAAGLDALAQLETQHRRQRQVLRNLHGAAGNTADRIERRLAMVSQLADAAHRAAETTATGDAAARDRALAACRKGDAELERLAEARLRARHALADVARLLDRQGAAEAELQALREEFTALRTQAERGLTLMASAGRLLDEVGTLYESAQLSASDLGRDLLPDPVGPRHETPADDTTASPLHPVAVQG
jgi:hypothetical protein